MSVPVKCLERGRRISSPTQRVEVTILGVNNLGTACKKTSSTSGYNHDFSTTNRMALYCTEETQRKWLFFVFLYDGE